MFVLKFLAVFVLSYLIGSINSSIIVSKIFIKDDIRNHGSKNAGATNALRVMGKKGGILTLVGDILKTVISVLIAMLILSEDKNIAIYTAGIAVALGHNFPVWFGFKGGKGVAVSITAFFFADYKIALIVLVLSLLIMIITKYVSLGSVLGAVLCLVLSLILRTYDVYYICFVIVVSLLVIIRHKANIIRLIKGTENKLGSSKK